MKVRLEDSPVTARLSLATLAYHRLHEASSLPDGEKEYGWPDESALRYFGKLAFGHLYDIDRKLVRAAEKQTGNSSMI